MNEGHSATSAWLLTMLGECSIDHVWPVWFDSHPQRPMLMSHLSSDSTMTTPRLMELIKTVGTPRITIDFLAYLCLTRVFRENYRRHSSHCENYALRAVLFPRPVTRNQWTAFMFMYTSPETGGFMTGFFFRETSEHSSTFLAWRKRVGGSGGHHQTTSSEEVRNHLQWWILSPMYGVPDDTKVIEYDPSSFSLGGLNADMVAFLDYMFRDYGDRTYTRL